MESAERHLELGSRRSAPKPHAQTIRHSVVEIRAKPYKLHVNQDAPNPGEPSGWRHRAPVIVLALAGLVISVYLACFQFGVVAHVWDPVFGTSTQVLTSNVSRTIKHWLGLPDAALGAVAYAFEAALAAWGDTQRWKHHPYRVLLYGLVVIVLALTGLGLVGLQAFYVRAWCLLCLASATISWVQIWLAHKEVLASWHHCQNAVFSGNS